MKQVAVKVDSLCRINPLCREEKYNEEIYNNITKLIKNFIN